MTETKELQKKKTKLISLLSDQILSPGPSAYKHSVLSTNHTAERSYPLSFSTLSSSFSSLNFQQEADGT